MPNEVDVELFRSLSLNNIYLMQLHGSGLLERLKILLSLYKSYSILLSTTYYKGQCSKKVQHCTVESPHWYLLAFWEFICRLKGKHLVSHWLFYKHMKSKLRLQVHINHHTKLSAKQTANTNYQSEQNPWQALESDRKESEGGLFERALDMKTVLLCFVPASGSF